MRVVILTSETFHHAFFVRELMKEYPVAGVFLESDGVKAPFDIAHPYETQRDEFEAQVFFSGKKTRIPEIFEEARTFNNVNSPDAVTWLKGLCADVFVTFGTRKINSNTVDQIGGTIVNLHGGDPERYRGLDTHLWSIYHDDYKSLVTTIHRLNPTLDDGDIILEKSLSLNRGMDLHMLRKVNAEACVELTLGALDMFKRRRNFISRPQQQLGRYYSFMPACLKEVCLHKFRRHTETLIP